MIFCAAVAFCFYVMGMAFGRMDARDIDDRVHIDHPARAAQVFFFGAIGMAALWVVQFFMSGLSLWHMLGIGIAYGVFAVSDRYWLNTSRMRPPVNADYMGPSVRGKQESWYDGLWWWLTRKVERRYVTAEGMRTVFARTGPSPFVAAVVWECSVALLSALLITLHT